MLESQRSDTYRCISFPLPQEKKMKSFLSYVSRVPTLGSYRGMYLQYSPSQMKSEISHLASQPAFSISLHPSTAEITVQLRVSPILKRTPICLSEESHKNSIINQPKTAIVLGQMTILAPFSKCAPMHIFHKSQ